MFTMIMVLLLALAPQDAPDTPADATNDPAAELTKICSHFTQSENYAFKFESKDESTGFGGRMRGGRSGNQPAPAVKCRYQKDKPVQIKIGDVVEAYRLDQDVVYRQGEGSWELFDRQSMRGGFGRRGAGGREGGAAGGQRMSREEMIKQYHTDGDGQLNEEERAKAREAMRGNTSGAGEQRISREEMIKRFDKDGDGQLSEEEEAAGSEAMQREARAATALRSLSSLSRISLPHETIKKINGKVENIQCEPAEDGIVYTGVLTAEAAQAIGGGGFRFGRSRGGENAETGPAFDFSGTVRFTAKEKGRIELIEITTLMKGMFREREFEMKRTTTITLSEIGKVEYEVPQEAMDKFAL